ncbi:VTT domain-containing protein [Xylanimonas protaetiae]|uniref:VTT domain-containing protein n=1 Tax=Xylanimonas protaetiae TaxID=2509457 RepID=UPI0013EBA9C7|nr:VTT domain-containing protein [Xylanimonas protaetiae]
MLEALTTFGVSILSAVLPFVNLEVYLGLLATRLDGEVAAVVTCAVVTGVGSAIGKLVWYLLAARSMDTPWVRKKLSKESWQRRFDRWQAALDGKPWLAAAVLLAASVVGVPPLLVMALVAGALRVPMWVFLPTVTVGRAVRAWLILAGVGFALGW